MNKENSSHKSTAFAEVLHSSLTSFLAQSWQWNTIPPFASLVQVDQEDYTIIGYVIDITTGSPDTTRFPQAYKKTPEQLFAEQPQIFELITTTFRVHIAGVLDKGSISYQLPKKPCLIHSFVEKTSQRTQELFYEKSDFLHLLFSIDNPVPHLDELLLAIMQQLTKQQLLTEKKLHEMCRTLNLLTGNDYRRLKLFLSRAQNYQIG